MIDLHIALITACVLVCIVSILVAPGRPSRSFHCLLIAMIPFLILGVFSTLLLSISGSPSVEWILPAVCVGLVVLFCHSTKLTTASCVVLGIITLSLHINFFTLVHDGYTANPDVIVKLSSLKQNRVVNQGKHDLEVAKPVGGRFEQGRVALLLADSRYDLIPVVHVVSEWHTPFTRMYGVAHSTQQLWTTGGSPIDAANHTELRSE